MRLQVVKKSVVPLVKTELKIGGEFLQHSVKDITTNLHSLNTSEEKEKNHLTELLQGQQFNIFQGQKNGNGNGFHREKRENLFVKPEEKITVGRDYRSLPYVKKAKHILTGNKKEKARFLPMVHIEPTG